MLWITSFVSMLLPLMAVGRCAWKHRATGKSMDTPKDDLLRLRDGKIVQLMEFYDTAAALAATAA